jgi:predicted O-linked N-acetylglucosamine transferase (SPINDLY family)
VFHQQGQHAEAEDMYRATLRLDAECTPALQNLGAVLFQQGRHLEALSALDQALPLDPHNAIVHGNRGNVLGELQRLDEALASYERALQIDPHYAAAFSNRAHVLLTLGRAGDALRSAERALELAPGNAFAINNRGKALAALERHAEALACFDQALALQPGWPLALVNRSGMLLILHRVDEALRNAEDALRLEPKNALALDARGSALRALQRHLAALACFDEALMVDPALAIAHYNRGMTLIDLERHEPALDSFERTLRISSDCAEAQYGRGIALMRLKRTGEAAEAFSAAVTMAAAGRRSLPYARGFALYASLQQADWRDYEAQSREVREACMRGEPAAEPFSFLALTASASEQLQCARSYVDQRYPIPSPQLWEGLNYDHSRVRLGYLSGDFGDHPVSYLMAGVFEHHDRSRFEVIGLSPRPPHGGAFAKRVRSALDRCIDVSVYTDHDIAKLIRTLEIDILVDLMGFTRGTRFGVLTHRPAPVQISYLGYPGSMGSRYVDYLLGDSFIVPHALRPLYGEAIVDLPGCFQANDAARHVPVAPARAAAALPADAFVLCCFNTSTKISPAFFDIWCRLLQSVSHGVLWLLAEDNETRANLLREATTRGIPAERLIFARRVAYEDHLARLQVADLFLDTYPFNAGTTASDALRVGVPVLTCAGEAYASRMAGSLLVAAGVPELVTHSLADYEKVALDLARNPAALATIRDKLSAQRERLFDTARFCRHLEQAYLTMYERVRRGEPPASFAVPAHDPA